MGQWLSNRWNFGGFPRLNFFLDFVADLLLVVAVNVGLRGFVGFVTWLDRRFPMAVGAGNPAPHSYLPIEHVTFLLTVVHLVSILSISFSAIMTLVKVIRSGLSND